MIHVPPLTVSMISPSPRCRSALLALSPPNHALGLVSITITGGIVCLPWHMLYWIGIALIGFSRSRECGEWEMWCCGVAATGEGASGDRQGPTSKPGFGECLLFRLSE